MEADREQNAGYARTSVRRGSSWNDFARVREDHAREGLKSGFDAHTRAVLVCYRDGEGYIAVSAKDSFKVRSTFAFREKAANIENAVSYERNSGRGAQGALNELELLAASGFKTAHLAAGLEAGAYFWARMGGLPENPRDTDIWDKTIARYQGVRWQLPEDKRAVMDIVIADRSPTSIWRVADARDDVAPALRSIFKKAHDGDEVALRQRHQILNAQDSDDRLRIMREANEGGLIPLGRYLLQGCAWDGRFDLSGAHGQMDRARNYVLSRGGVMPRFLANHHLANDR